MIHSETGIECNVDALLPLYVWETAISRRPMAEEIKKDLKAMYVAPGAKDASSEHTGKKEQMAAYCRQQNA